jgi:hypothetical protein
MAAMLHKLYLADQVANPPFVHCIPAKMAYVRHYALDMAYITPPNNNESMHTFRKRIYGVLRDMAVAGQVTTMMPITRKHPGTDWKRVWTNLHSAWKADSQNSTWYVVMQELIPTN